MQKLSGTPLKQNHSRHKLGMSIQDLRNAGALHTAEEISQQPAVWKRTWKLLLERKPEIDRFLQMAYAHSSLNIVLTGAGTSAYIGNILRPSFQRFTHKNTWAVATTDLVTHPHEYFHEQDITLLISFARSGNSPESLAAIRLAESLNQYTYHLIVTCNAYGDLANTGNSDNTLCVLLPPETNDKGLAMTSSFTAMLLAGLLIARITQIEEYESQVARLCNYGNVLLSNLVDQLKEVAKLDFKRAVFLGSGPLQGAARESQLKLQELTSGKVICKYDSFLGLRHGPKVVIDSTTLIVFLFSNSAYTHRYEADLVDSIHHTERGLLRIGIAESIDDEMNLDLKIELSNGDTGLEEEFLAVCSVLPAQIIAFFKAIQLKLQPDSPSVNGIISRVVQGVTIYPYPANNYNLNP